MQPTNSNDYTLPPVDPSTVPTVPLNDASFGNNSAQPSAPIQQQPMQMNQQMMIQQQIVSDMAMGGMEAGDVELIEKAWVEKAKAIVHGTRGNPYLQSKELSKVKAEYIKKRYSKDIKVAE